MAKTDTPAPTPAAPARTILAVRAIKLGFYPDPGEVRQRARQPGEVFVLRSEAHFAGPNKGAFQWMEWADEAPKAPAEAPSHIMSVPNRIQQDPLRPGALPTRQDDIQL